MPEKQGTGRGCPGSGIILRTGLERGEGGGRVTGFPRSPEGDRVITGGW